MIQPSSRPAQLFATQSVSDAAQTRKLDAAGIAGPSSDDLDQMQALINSDAFEGAEEPATQCPQLPKALGNVEPPSQADIEMMKALASAKPASKPAAIQALLKQIDSLLGLLQRVLTLPG